MNQQPPPDDSLTVRLQRRGQEALETALQEGNPLSCGLIAASTATLHIARQVGDALEKCMQDDTSLEQLARLSPFINQFVQLNRAGASLLHVHTRLSK